MLFRSLYTHYTYMDIGYNLGNATPSTYTIHTWISDTTLEMPHPVHTPYTHGYRIQPWKCHILCIHHTHMDNGYNLGNATPSTYTIYSWISDTTLEMPHPLHTPYTHGYRMQPWKCHTLYIHHTHMDIGYNLGNATP